MRWRRVLTISLVALASCFTDNAWSQLTYTVPVVDTSAPGSPLKISGSASFTELISANSVKSSGSFKIDALNLTGKAIVLVVARFHHGAPHGITTDQIIQRDHFFWGHIAPGESIVLARQTPSKMASAFAVNPLGPAKQPEAEIRMEYVQFADGSAFGDDKIARDALNLRLSILRALQRLDATHNREEFLALLSQKIQPEEADVFLEKVRVTRANHGTTAARSQVRAALKTAAEHAEAMRAVEAHR